MARSEPTLEKHISAATLHRRGHSYAQIAKALGITPDQARRCVAKARELLDAYATKFAADYIRASHVAAESGNHRPARDMLDRLGVTNPVPIPDEEAGGIRAGGVTINIGVAMPGVPGVSHAGAVTVTAQSGGVRQALDAVLAGVEPPTLSPLDAEVQSERVQEVEQVGLGPIMRPMSTAGLSAQAVDSAGDSTSERARE